MKAKRLLLLCWLLTVFSGIAFLFWYHEWKYNLPTPVPRSYQSVHTGDLIRLDYPLAVSGKPLFLHFFNPGCPCSRFNMSHFRSLVTAYSDRVQFVMVVMTENSKYRAQDLREKYDLDLPVVFDPSLAARCGVYSTPQAVILNSNHTLYYRGNYNKSRYCTDKNSNFAQIAIDSLLHSSKTIAFSALATTSYGCELPPGKK